MTKSKKYFLIGVIIFVIILIIIAIDINNRTIAPWERAKLEKSNE